MPKSFIALLFVLISVGCSEQPKPQQEAFQPKFNFLTSGDAAAGRQAFSDLKCGMCHVVAGDSLFQVDHAIGRSLGTSQSLQSASEIADSIVAPSHIVAGRTGVEDPVSPMQDYTKVMTVRQLTDLVAFVNSLPREK